MALPLISSPLTSCLRSSRAAPAQQLLSLLPSPRTMLFKTHAVKSANTHVFLSHMDLVCERQAHTSTHTSFAVGSLVHVLTCTVVPRSPGRTSHRVLSHPRTPLSCSSSAASVGIVPRGQWAHHDKLRLALIDLSAKLVEPSLWLDSPCITAILAHTLSDAELTPPLTAASGDPNCTAVLASCPVAI